MNILFAGSPSVSAEILEHLVQNKHLNVNTVLTQPDKRSKRGAEKRETPVSRVAKKHSIKTLKPKTIDKTFISKELSKSDIDLILVVGSENSSNSQRLVDVAKNSGCTKSYLIEDYKKIDWVKVKEANSIGITSGASAPDFLVKEVISSIQEKFDTSLVYDTAKKETIEFKVPLALR